jgi:hypothetical protein
MSSSIINICSVSAFALCLLAGFDFGSYLASMFIALSFVPMMCAFNQYSSQDKKAAGHASMAFAGAYAVMILMVYFAQVTAIRNDGLNEQALQIIDYPEFPKFFYPQ